MTGTGQRGVRIVQGLLGAARVASDHVLDLKAVRADPDRVRASQTARGADPGLVDSLLDADEARRSALTSFEAARAEQKDLGRQVSGARGPDRDELLARTRELSSRVKQLDAGATAAGDDFDRLARAIPNVIGDGVPPGGEDDYVVLRQVGAPRDFAAEGFEPLDHVALGEGLHAIDIARGTKVSGSRFVFLTGVGALMDLALTNLAVQRGLAAGFAPVIPPTMVRPSVMAGTGFLGDHAPEVYRLEADDLYLTGTSEVALAGYHAEEILDLTEGPLRYAGISTCYRREAGSYGKDTAGMIRVHQFSKVEMFSYVPVEEADAEHARLLAIQEAVLSDLGLPYRVIETAAGDLGTSAARKYDCEAWIPSQGRHRELTSTSNCTTFQARRLGIRERTADGVLRPVATLNGTLATTRWIVALLENHQLPDGSVRVPEVLRPHLGGRELLTRVAGSRW